MSLALSVIKYAPAGVPERVFLKGVASGNYVTGGDALNLNPGTYADPKGQGVIGYPSSPPSVPPICRETVGMTESGNNADIEVLIIPGATLGNYLFQIFVDGAELSAAAYPAAILAGYFVIDVEF